jgi:isopenicillin N synthase-like dioxygenase
MPDWCSPVHEIPTIDLTNGPAAVADDVRRACEEVGFLTVVGHGVPDDVVAGIASGARRFFDRPCEEKDHFAGPAEMPGLPVYRPLGAEKLGANADQKASLDWGPSLAGVAWPDRDLHTAYERYFAEMLRLAGALTRSFALALGLAEDALEPYFDNRSSSIRVIDYPGAPTRGTDDGACRRPRSVSDFGGSAPAGGGGARAGAHRDYGCLTIIRSDAGGLEAQTRSGEWLAVAAPPDGFVVNIGDLMQRWTGDRWVSTLHRVVGTEGASPRRQSLVFFHNPRSDAVIETLGDGRSYEPVTAGDYVLARAAEAGL